MFIDLANDSWWNLATGQVATASCSAVECHLTRRFVVSDLAPAEERAFQNMTRPAITRFELSRFSFNLSPLWINFVFRVAALSKAEFQSVEQKTPPCPAWPQLC